MRGAADDVTPDELMRVAEALGAAMVEGAAAEPPVAWAALPVREVEVVAETRRAATERLLAWARSLGAAWDGVAFEIDAAGDASARASRALVAGEPILTVPRRSMIVDNELAASTTGQPELGLDAPDPSDALAAWLALEAGEPASKWRAFLDALPARLDMLPMFHDDLGALAGTAAHALAAEKNRDVRDTYARLSPALQARLSLADFAWGHALVMSRGYHAPGTLEHRIALLPVSEMLNHGIGDTTWTYEPREGFVIRTERAIPRGAEVSFPYGARSNTHLMVHFGFALPRNPDDEAALDFGRAADPINAAAAHLLWQLPLAAPARLRVGCVLDERFVRALSLARLAASGAVERAQAIELGLTPYGDLPWLGAAVEDAALEILAAAARRGLAALELPPVAPVAPVAQDAWGATCALVRDGERGVLAQILAFTRLARAPTSEVPDDATGRLLRDYRDLIQG